MANITALNIGGIEYEINVASAISWSGISAAVESAIGDKIAGVYTVRGTKTVAQINALTDMKVGDVYNVSDSGTIAGQPILAGDNVVCTATTGTNKWDKLAATIDTSKFVKNDDATYTATSARAKKWADTSANLIASANSGAAASAWITAHSGDYASSTHTHAISDVTNLGTYTGYAKDWNDTKNNLINSAKSGWSALSSISENSAKWVSGEANQNAYAKVSVFTAAGAAVSAAASAKQDTFAFSAWGSNIALTATSDTNGNPVIGISGKNTTYSLSGWNGVAASYTADGSTTALKVSGVPATSAVEGVTKASYVSSNVAYIF